MICVTNITSHGIDFSYYSRFIAENEYRTDYRRFTVNRGDLLLSSSGNSWGKVAEYDSNEQVILNTSTIRLNENRGANLQKGLMKWILQSDATREQLGLMMTGACQPNFGPSHISKVAVAIPPKDEQVRIAHYLDSLTKRIDLLADKIAAGIEKLRQHRSALISNAVTGQIDVRNYRAEVSE